MVMARGYAMKNQSYVLRGEQDTQGGSVCGQVGEMQTVRE